ncbi:hypothetical protein [Mucilaginibacter flavus]|uniref:hypothetical protein n=1 Tax=Mucilaginibacter flavus TaxID=931504 RepID=UPI0025B5AEE2|nr:hypothetical protein [Mucilaginibacter flavus]MDN3580368.1 hypothetical protein [Mucilaginibacter flavus]
MKEKIGEIMTCFLGLEKRGISETVYTNGIFSFKYGGGKFILIGSVAPNLLTGFINAYHETPFEGDKHMIEVADFEILVSKDNWGFSYKIKNYIDFNPDDYRRMVDDKGYMRIEQDDLLYIFPNQFVSKLVKDNFRIYLT